MSWQIYCESVRFPGHAVTGRTLMPGRNRAVIGLTMLMLASLACLAQSGTSDTPTAMPLPSVVFVAPQNNSLVADGAEITLAAYAQDSGGISKIDFLVDDTPIGSQSVPAAGTQTPQTSFTARQVWKASG